MRKAAARRSIVLSMLIFGSVGVFRRSLAMGSGWISFCRALLGLLFLLLLCVLRRQPPDWAAIRRNLPRLCVSGLLLGLNWVLLFEAYTYTTVAAATMCYYMAPVFVSLVSALRGVKLGRRGWLCAAAAFTGMLLVSGVLQTGLQGTRGLLLGLFAAVLYAAIVLLNHALHDITAPDRTLVQLAAATLTLLPYVLLKGELPAAWPGTVPVLLLLVMGFVHTGLAYVLYFGGMASVPAATAAQLSYIDPVVAVLLSVTLLSEPVSLPALAGCVIVIAALILSERRQSEP